MSVSVKTRQAYTEVDAFLDLLSEKQKNEIPQNLRKLFKEEKDNEYYKVINPNMPIKEQNLLEETLAIIALLNLKYWCKDENEKQRLNSIYHENEEKCQQELRKKYATDNLFNNKQNINEMMVQETSIVEYKEKSFIQKIFDKIKEFLRNK